MKRHDATKDWRLWHVGHVPPALREGRIARSEVTSPDRRLDDAARRATGETLGGAA